MASEAAAAKKSNWLKIIIFVAVIAAVVIAVRQLGYMKYLQSPQLLKEAIDGLGFWGPVVFILLWVASAAFLAGKYVARDMVKGLVESNPKLKKIDEGVKKEGWRFVMLTRLVPVFPYNAQNYVYAMTAIKLPIYALATFVFMLPGCFAFSFAGGAVSAGGSPTTIIAYLAVAGVALFAISLIPKYLKKKHGDVLEEDE